MKREMFKKVGWMFASLWVAQWMVAAYTLDVRFAYGGAATMLALIIILVGLDIDADIKKDIRKKSVV